MHSPGGPEDYGDQAARGLKILEEGRPSREEDTRRLRERLIARPGLYDTGVACRVTPCSGTILKKVSEESHGSIRDWPFIAKTFSYVFYCSECRVLYHDLPKSDFTLKPEEPNLG